LPHPLSPPALAKILWHSGMKSNNTCNSLTHAVISSYLKEIVGTLGLGLGPKKIYYNNHKTCNWFEEIWCRIDWVCGWFLDETKPLHNCLTIHIAFPKLLIS
jgi:hypothetical protein